MGSGGSKKYPAAPGQYPTQQTQQRQPAPQQQQQQQQQKPAGQQAQANRPRITKETLKRYVELELQTRKQDNRAIIDQLRAKKQQCSDLDDTIRQLEGHLAECQKRTEKEKSDVDRMNQASVKQFFEDQEAYDTKLSEEQEEYVAALTEQESVEKQLGAVKQQRSAAAAEIESMGKEVEASFAIYKEQDEILASLFNGEYGSAEENRLEAEYDLLVDRKQRVAVARFKWHNARVLVHHASNQLGHGCRKWAEVVKVPASNPKLRYTYATEARNNLVAAVTNIQNAQRYLNNIQFPYCNQKEMDTLTQAYNNVYTDMNTEERHGHAQQCYDTTHKRAAALIQWFDHVIKSTIVKDLEKLTKELDAKYRELKKERERLIRQLVAEQGDSQLAAMLDEKLGDGGKDTDEKLHEEQGVEADKVSEAGDLMDDGGLDGPLPAPMALGELAPPPSNQDLFGDIEQLKKQHQQHLAEFQHTQEVNKARVDQGLEEKLRQRRHRRALQHSLD